MVSPFPCVDRVVRAWPAGVMSGARGMWVAVSVCLACGGGGGGGDTADTDADSDSGVPSGGGEVCEGEVHNGEATYYAADGSGNCSFDANPGDPMVAAMNIVDYA